MTSSHSQPSLFQEIRVFGIDGLPEIHPGDNLPALLFSRFSAGQFSLRSGDICIVTQKIISKAEGCLVDLRTITPSHFAQNFADRIHKDPRLLEVILRESKRVVRMDRDILICETKHGFICANAGVDQSNIPGDYIVSVLPSDPDESARKFRRGLQAYFHIDVPVIITDTFGRPWREGLTNVAIGVAGLNSLIDLRGKKDACGFELQKTMIAVADEIASAAELVMKKQDRIPIAFLRGYAYEKSEAGSQVLLRPPEKDLFR
jgi:coenzyme F420-0:L-glutamate ligase / coenzyme F420-1:gamma-L-glutamate ligase